MPNKQIGIKLRELRQPSQKSIKEAAAEAGIDPKALPRIERGRADFRILTLEKLCRIYNVAIQKTLIPFSQR